MLDAGRIAATADPPAVARAARRDARLRGWWLVVGAIDDLDAAVMRTLADGDRVVLVGQGRWDPAWSTEAPPTVEIGPMAPAARRAQWSQALGDRLDDVAGLSTFVLDGDAIRRSVAMAERLAAMEGVPLAAAHVAAGARAQNGNTLDRLARRIEPEVGLDDMVLKPQVRSLLEDVIGRARHRDVVLDQWRMRPGGGRGRGVTALFAGEPGTGKTMAAEAVARELGLDLYAIDLASVVDKYIGETEKNLERIFAAAEGLNAVLLFDEADALFGKRSEVSDAHDRYANIEVRLPAAAHGELRRPGRPGDQPAGQHRRGVRPPPRCRRRVHHPRRGPATAAVGDLPSAAAPGGRRRPRRPARTSSRSRGATSAPSRSAPPTASPPGATAR